MAALAAELGWAVAEGDEFHPDANVAKMERGQPLTDADRRPWLLAIARWIGRQEAAGTSSIVTSSALRRPYRDLLRKGHASMTFVELDAPRSILEARIRGRRGHFMPVSLLESQLATLEPLEPDEPGFRVEAAAPAEEIARVVIDRLRARLADSMALGQTPTTSALDRVGRSGSPP
jgi:gluconokinase